MNKSKIIGQTELNSLLHSLAVTRSKYETAISKTQRAENLLSERRETEFSLCEQIEDILCSIIELTASPEFQETLDKLYDMEDTISEESLMP